MFSFFVVVIIHFFSQALTTTEIENGLEFYESNVRQHNNNE